MIFSLCSSTFSGAVNRVGRKMSIGTLVGIAVLASSVSLTTYLVIWSTHSINNINRKKGRTLREILKERRGEK